jgi:DNA-binding NtrC family response regulator
MHTFELCQSYSWLGNIRDLQNIVERSVILNSGDIFWIEKAWLASPEPPRQVVPSLRWLNARGKSLDGKASPRSSEFPDRRWTRSNS